MYHRYSLKIKEIHLDIFGHVNNATYLTLLEEARWSLITENGYGLEKIRETAQGPVILEIHIRYLRELVLNDDVVIESYLPAYDKKIAKMTQKILRGNEECSVADITFGLFDLKTRKLIAPTEDWLRACGITS